MAIPVLLSPMLPPTSLRPGVDAVAPSVNDANCVRSRCPEGSVSSTAAFITCCVRTLWTSTTGLAPVITSVSSRSDPHVRTDRRGESRRELDAFVLDGAEADQGERHRVNAWSEIDDLVFASLVGDDGSHFLDQCGTSRFYYDPRQHCGGRVSRRARDTAT